MDIFDDADQATISTEPRSASENVIVDPFIDRRRSLTAAIVMVIPALGTIAAACLAAIHPIRTSDLLLFAVMMSITIGLGITVGYHRLFTHRSFESPPVVRFLLATAGAMAFQGPPLYWVSIHRRHHEYSDEHGDPHSPSPVGHGVAGWLRGLWHGHLGWMMDHEMPDTLHYAPKASAH